jgi:hypothetical protein
VRIAEPTTQSKELFPLAVALRNEAVGLLGHVFIKEVRILLDDHFEGVIEHLGGGEEIPAVAYPFGGPDGTNDMGMPVLPSVAIYQILAVEGEDISDKRPSIAGQEEMAFLVGLWGLGKEEGAPEL